MRGGSSSSSSRRWKEYAVFTGIVILLAGMNLIYRWEDHELLQAADIRVMEYVLDEDRQLFDLASRAQAREKIMIDSMLSRGKEEEEESNKKLHILYNVGCGGGSMTEWQLTQSAILDYSWAKVKQFGKLTRIVSGCENDPKRRAYMKQTSLRPDSEAFSRFEVLFVPRTDNLLNGKTYVQLNRPNALLTYFNSTHDDNNTVYCVLDPDFAFVTRLDHNIVNRVELNRPLGGYYSIGTIWRQYFHTVCNESGFKNCDSESELLKHGTKNVNEYQTGVPYLMMKKDWLRLLPRWIIMIPKLFKHFDDITSDMHSYAMAAFMERLPHEIHKNFMSTCMRGDDPEYDPFVGSIWLHYCSHYFTLETRGALYEFTPASQEMSTSLLQTGHPKYSKFVYIFNKHWLKNLRSDRFKDILDCSMPLLVEPPEDLKEDQIKVPVLVKGLQVTRFIVPLINEVLVSFRQVNCPKETALNFSKLIILHETSSKRFQGRLHHLLGEAATNDNGA